MKTCPYCAEQIQEAAVKCRHCGEKLSDDGAVRRSHTKAWVISSISVLILGVIGGLIAYKAQSGVSIHKIEQSVSDSVQERNIDTATSANDALDPVTHTVCTKIPATDHHYDCRTYFQSGREVDLTIKVAGDGWHSIDGSGP